MKRDQTMNDYNGAPEAKSFGLLDFNCYDVNLVLPIKHDRKKKISSQHSLTANPYRADGDGIVKIESVEGVHDRYAKIIGMIISPK